MIDTTNFSNTTCAATGGLVSATFAAFFNISDKIQTAHLEECAYCLDAPENIPTGEAGTCVGFVLR